jgi:ABC-type nitrate/sulfonate/bicarbonate transport system substrate-binding protein
MRPWPALALVLLGSLLVGCATDRGGSPQPAAAPPAAAALGEPTSPPAVERINLGLPVVTGVFGPHVLARDKGFFRAEGLDVEFPIMRTNLVVTALTTGEVQFNSMFGPSVPPILSGQPHRVLAAVVARSTRRVMVVPGIQTMEQLRGKAIAVSALGGGPYNSGRLAVEAYGIDPDSEVTWLAIGGTPERLAAMQQGGAQASVFSGPEVPQAEQFGLQTLLRLDEVAPLPESGLTTSLDIIQNRPDLVRRVLRALVRSLQYAKADREGTLPSLQQFMGVSRELAEQAYDGVVAAYSDDGTVSERAVRFTIDAEKKQLGIAEDVPSARVVDFAPLYAVLAEMGITPAPDAAR